MQEWSNFMVNEQIIFNLALCPKKANETNTFRVMKILIAPDSFKGSLSAVEICNLFLKKIKKHWFRGIAFADGGKGSLQVISVSKEFEKITLPVSNPLFEDISAYIGW